MYTLLNSKMQCIATSIAACDESISTVISDGVVAAQILPSSICEEVGEILETFPDDI